MCLFDKTPTILYSPIQVSVVERTVTLYYAEDAAADWDWERRTERTSAAKHYE